jgi:capsular polysaccharide transport system permease protein
MLTISDDNRPWWQTWTELLRGQLRVIGALVRRETRAHFGESRLGYLWAVIEPLIHLLAYAVLFSFILRRRPLVGGSLVLFIVTGLVPYFLYSKLASYMTGAIVENRALLNLPLVKPFDVFASRAILESTTYLFVGVILLVGLFLSGVPQAVPRDPLNLAAAIIVIVSMGCGLGMVNAVLQTFISNWHTIFTLVSGPLYLLSGIYFLIDEIPPPLRDYLLYNPLLHLVGWFRSGFYPNYSVTYIDHGYALCWSIAALLLGLGVQRVARRKLLEP